MSWTAPNAVLANLYSLAACPSCGSLDVLLSKEPHRVARAKEKAISPAVERGPKAETVKGVCPVCGRQVRLTAKKGVVATHVTGGERCSGMGRSPGEVAGSDASDGEVPTS
jgi:rRNA maturation protein Nop10